ncbi:MAG: type II toxin-antitoxin system HicB family antitoxin [Chitinophagaceae bacterium]|nr:type II toxin-antitoxin system HicB family antitoxin [Chitinophagaceae bacterium]
MVRYAIIIEKSSEGGYSAYVPDLPGCIGMGSTKEETMENIAQAIIFHLEGMKAEGLPIPPPASEAENLVLAIA